MSRSLKTFLALFLFISPIIANAVVTITFPNIINDKPLCYEQYDLVFIAEQSFINNSVYCANSLKISSPHIKQGILCWKEKLAINDAERQNKDPDNKGPWYGAADCNALCAKYCA